MDRGIDESMRKLKGKAADAPSALKEIEHRLNTLVLLLGVEGK